MVPNAALTLVDQATDVEARTVSNEAGSYVSLMHLYPLGENSLNVTMAMQDAHDLQRLGPGSVDDEI